MAVTTTPQQIIDAAYAKSTKNVPGQLASESTELLSLVGRSQRALFAFAARVNPMCFGASTVVAYDGPTAGWPRPQDAESIFRVTGSTSGQCAVVPYDDPGAEIGKPSLVEMGQVFRRAVASGITTPANAESLTFEYSKRPIMPATLAATLDPLWLESYNELLILDVASYLAQKDGRGDEVQMLDAEKGKWVKLYVAHLEHATANMVRRSGHVRTFNTNALVSLNDLLGTK